jgi:hypothetical protein
LHKFEIKSCSTKLLPSRRLVKIMQFIGLHLL